MEKWKNEWDTFSTNEKVILTSILSVVLPFIVTIAVCFVAFIYVIYKRQILLLLRTQTTYLLLTSLLTVNMIISFVYTNWVGLIFTFIMWITLTLACYYRAIVTRKMFEFLVYYLTRLSIFPVLYLLLAYIFSRFVIQLYPHDYSNLLFFNSNYASAVYGMIIMLCCYGLIEHKDYTYIGIGLFNIIGIILADGRGAFLAVIISVVIFALMLRKKVLIKNRLLIILGLIFILLYMLLGYFHIVFVPEVAYLKRYLTLRIGIWYTGFESFLKHPIIGQGQYTHYNYCTIYGTWCGAHSHNTYLELLVAYGISGFLVLVYVLIKELKAIFIASKVGERIFWVLTFNVLLLNMIHGIVDYQLFWIQSGYLFFILMGSYGALKNKVNQSNYEVIEG